MPGRKRIKGEGKNKWVIKEDASLYGAGVLEFKNMKSL